MFLGNYEKTFGWKTHNICIFLLKFMLKIMGNFTRNCMTLSSPHMASPHMASPHRSVPAETVSPSDDEAQELGSERTTAPGVHWLLMVQILLSRQTPPFPLLASQSTEKSLFFKVLPKNGSLRRRWQRPTGTYRGVVVFWMFKYFGTKTFEGLKIIGIMFFKIF